MCDATNTPFLNPVRFAQTVFAPKMKIHAQHKLKIRYSSTFHLWKCALKVSIKHIVTCNLKVQFFNLCFSLIDG